MLLLGAHCRGCRGILLLPQREWRRKKQLYACDHCYTSQLIYFVPRYNQHHWLGSKLFSFPLVNRVPCTQGTRAAAPNPTGSGCPHQLSPGLVMLHRIPPPGRADPSETQASSLLPDITPEDPKHFSAHPREQTSAWVLLISCRYKRALKPKDRFWGFFVIKKKK